MKKLISIFIFTITLISLMACNQTSSKNLPLQGDSSTQVAPHATDTPIPTPTATATPTPLPQVRIENGEYYLFTGDYQKAAAEFETAINNSSDTDLVASAQVNLARIDQLNNLCNLAIPTLEPISNDETIATLIRAKAVYFLATCYQQTNQWLRAADTYQRYVELNPGILDESMLENAGDAFSLAGDNNSAIILYEKAIASTDDGSQISAKIKLGQTYAALSDHTNAIRIFMEVHDSSNNDYTRAQMNLLAGQSYLLLGLPEQAYARFQESVQNYPKSFDTYSGLVTLVNEGVVVDEFYRGLVDYYAGRYGLAIDAFNRYLNANADHNGSAHYFKALSYQAINQPAEAIQEWQTLILDHTEDRFYVDAWEDIAYTQWAYQDDFLSGAATLLSFVSSNPVNENAPQALYDAGRIYERGGYLTEAAQTWARLIDEYPQAEISSQALFMSGISYYRLEKFDLALQNFQRVLLFGGSSATTAAAQLWIGKTYQMQGDSVQAQTAWQQAEMIDPTGYYSERASQLLNKEEPYTVPLDINMTVNLDQERIIAEIWMQKTFSLAADTNFTTLGDLNTDINFKQAQALWDLGLYQQARDKFETVREAYNQDALNLFRLTNYFDEIGLYRSAIYGSRQILELANMNDLGTLQAPLWFNHIRFGDYYPEIVSENANRYNLDPILLLSLMRQESFFEGFIASSAGARGVMQIMPATGNEINSNLSWPENYTDEDLYIPAINIRFGASYLARMKDYFDGDMFAALAAYNAGPGNVLNWEDEANNDPDLFLEVIPYEETRRYITNIYEFYQLYAHFYLNTQ